MRHGTASGRSAPFKATSIPRCYLLPPPSATVRSATYSSGRTADPATSSTSAMACCPKRTSAPFVPSWTSCMAREPPPIAVLVMAYGGPAKLDDVEPYLMDVRGGRATTPQLVAEFRARYARIGGRSPILELTRAQAARVAPALCAGLYVSICMRPLRSFIPPTGGA